MINYFWFKKYDDPNTTSFNRNYEEIKNETTGVIEKVHSSGPFIDAVDFTFTTFSTVGYGDITPKTTLAKSWVIIMHSLVIFMTYKLFEYIYSSDKTSLHPLINQISSLSSNVAELTQENKNLKEEFNKKIINNQYNIQSTNNSVINERRPAQLLKTVAKTVGIVNTKVNPNKPN
jgi:hypothetical protein